jgi:hypothetical protein
MQGQLLGAAKALGAAAVLDKNVAPDILVVAVDSLLEYGRETAVT